MKDDILKIFNSSLFLANVIFSANNFIIKLSNDFYVPSNCKFLSQNNFYGTGKKSSSVFRILFYALRFHFIIHISHAASSSNAP